MRYNAQCVNTTLFVATYVGWIVAVFGSVWGVASDWSLGTSLAFFAAGAIPTSLLIATNFVWIRRQRRHGVRDG